MTFKSTIPALLAPLVGIVVIADPITDRLDVLEGRVQAIESRLEPATQPTTKPVTVRADTIAEVRAAIAAGATLILTSGVDLVGELDARGATIELLPGGPSWKPAISLTGTLRNATVKTPPSTYNAAGQRTAFWKAIATNGDSVLENVTFAPDTGFCLHVGKGNLVARNVWASTFSEYFVFQEAGTDVHFTDGGFRGGSRAESGWRVSMARYVIEDAIFDNSSGGKASVRGDSPPRPDGSPGGIIRRSSIVGQYGPNPLTEDDGGQMNGIDRFRIDGAYLRQLPAAKKPEAIAFAQSLRAQGKSKREIVRACADKWFPGQVSEREIDLTLQLRDQDVGRFSYARIEDSEILGDVRINARERLEIVRTKLRGEQPFSGASQSTYPFPADRVLDASEIAPPPVVILEDVQVTYTKQLGLDLTKWPSIRQTGATAIRKAAEQ